MSASLTPEQRRLFEEANFGSLATLMPDGSPQVTTVWVDARDDTVVVNTSTGRIKERNLRRDPRVAISVIDRENPYRQVIVRGEVAEITEEGAREHIDAMSAKYLGQPEYPWLAPGERRVKLVIRPRHIFWMG